MSDHGPHAAAARGCRRQLHRLHQPTGSHLALADDEELALEVLWRAVVHDGLLTLWQITDPNAPAPAPTLGEL